MDLDHFKRVNDAHGHQAGDRVLREVAERLRIWSDSQFDPKVVEAFLELEQEGLVGTFSRVPILGVM